MSTERPVREEHTSTTEHDTVHGGSDRREPSGKLLIVCQEAGGGILAVLPFALLIAYIYFEKSIGLMPVLITLGVIIVGTILKLIGSRKAKSGS